MAKYDDTFAPVKAKLLRRGDRVTRAYTKALEELARFQALNVATYSNLDTYIARREELETKLTKAGNAVDKWHADYHDYEYGDRPDGN